MKSVCAVITMLFVSLFSRPLMAVENASWGEVKSLLVTEAPAGKLVISCCPVAGTRERGNVVAGPLVIDMAPSTHSMQYRKAGDDVNAVTYRFSAGYDDDIVLSRLFVTALATDVAGNSIDPRTVLSEVKMYGNYVAEKNLWAEGIMLPSGVVSFILPTYAFHVPYAISTLSTITFKVLPGTAPGTRIQLALYPTTTNGIASVFARGRVSGLNAVNARTIQEPLYSRDVIIVD